MRYYETTGEKKLTQSREKYFARPVNSSVGNVSQNKWNGLQHARFNDSEHSYFLTSTVDFRKMETMHRPKALPRLFDENQEKPKEEKTMTMSDGNKCQYN